MKLETTLKPNKRVTLTWWGCATIVIESGEHAITIDPYLHPTEPRYEYLFCTHEHYDHAYPPTVEKLSQGKGFQKAILTRSCILPTTLFYARQITFLPPEKLIIFYPKIYDRARPREFPDPTEMQLGNWYVEGIESPGEEASVPIPVEGPIPQLAYLIRDMGTGVSFLHLGDMRYTYPDLAEVRNKNVDFLFLPLEKLGHDEDARVLELIRPRYVVPIHYRYEGDYPIPKLYKDDEPIEQKVLGHHFPGPDDPDAYIRHLRQQATPLGIEVLPLQAGVVYEL